MNNLFNDIVAFCKYLWEWVIYLSAWTMYYISWIPYLFQGVFRGVERKIYNSFGTFNALVIFWNLFMILIAELLYLADATGAVMYLIWITLGKKLLGFFFMLFMFDQSVDLFRKTTNRPPAHPFELTALDRGFALAAGIWPMGEIFMFCQESVRMYDFTTYLNHEYFRGLVVLFSAAPLTTVIISFLVYNQIVRKMGSDTRWFGALPARPIKYVIRYHWCFALCQHTIITLWIFCFLKFGVANGLKGDGQEVWITSFLFMNMAVTAYQMICAIIGVKCPFPIIHRACIFNCGRQKGSKDGRGPSPEEPDNK